MPRAVVDRYSPFDGPIKRRLRKISVELCARAGLRLEKLENTDSFVRDGSSMVPDLLAKAVEIPGMINLRRGTIMYYLSVATAALEGDVIEIGSWQGRSTVFLAQGCEDSNAGVVHAIDTFRGNPGTEANYVVGNRDLSDLESRFRNNMAAAGLGHRVCVHVGSSGDAVDAVRAEVKNARLIYVDGDHSFDAASADLRNYADLLCIGGLLTLDDYSVSLEGPRRAVAAHLAAHPGRYGRPIQDDNFLVLRRVS